MPNFNDMLQVYLVPFAIAVPIGLLLIFFGLRRGNRDQNADIPDIEPEVRRSPSVVPTPAAPPASAPVAAPATDLDLDAPAARPEAPPAHGVSVSPGGAVELPISQHEKTQVFRREDFAPREFAATQPPSVLPHEDLGKTPPRLLVVDDSAVPRAKLKKLFEGAGYVVETAADGLDALEVIGRSARFHVIVTDLEMPNLDGFGLIEAVQGSLETEDIPIIAITGHDEMQARVHNIQGLFGIFKKPWNDRDLLKRVEVLAALRK